MRRSVVTLLAIGAALLLAPAAQAVDPLPLKSATPADGAIIPPTPTGGIPWQITITGPPPDANVSVTVTNSPATAPDGVTLSDENRVDFFFLSESTTTAGGYSGRSDPGPNAWSADAATYYWQVRATWTDELSVFHAAASKIESLVIGTPPPAGSPTGAPPSAPGQAPPSSTRTTLAMSSLDATFYVRAVIRQRTSRQPRNLRYRCARRSSRSFRCRPSWRDSRNFYSATVTFTHARTGQRIVARGTFSGRRASRRCARSRTVASCGRRFRWHTVTAARPVGARRASRASS
jgi:hypothetical protein